MCSGGGAVRVTLYRLLGPSPLTRRGETPFGRSSTLKTCRAQSGHGQYRHGKHSPNPNPNPNSKPNPNQVLYSSSDRRTGAAAPLLPASSGAKKSEEDAV